MTAASLLSTSRLKTIAVTGAETPIGSALIARLVGEGYRVAALHAEHPTPSVAALTAPLDVTDPRACAAAIADIQTELGPVDGLVVIGAREERCPFLKQPPERFAQLLRTNAEGAANAIRAVLPGMLARGFGRIVVIGTLADMNPSAGSLAYAMGRGAIHALVKGVAVEIAAAGGGDILVNELNPGTKAGPNGTPVEAEEASDSILALLSATEASPTGRMFLRDREIRPGEGFKAKLQRALLRQ